MSARIIYFSLLNHGFESVDVGQHLHISLLLHFFWGLFVQELQGMLECGCRFEQMFESLVLLDGLQGKHCRLCPFLVMYLKMVLDGYHNWEYLVQIAVRAGGFSAMVVVGMAVIGVAILYATFYVWLGVDSPGSMKVTDCMW